MGNIGINDIEYVRFRVTKGEAYYRGIHSGLVADLPNGRRLFASKLWNGLDIILISEAVKLGDDGFCSQRIYVFDKPFDLSYKGDLVVLFRLGESSDGFYECDVLISTDSAEYKLGTMRMRKGWGITFDNDKIEDTLARRLYTKVVLMRG